MAYRKTDAEAAKAVMDYIAEHPGCLRNDVMRKAGVSEPRILKLEAEGLITGLPKRTQTKPSKNHFWRTGFKLKGSY